jgi:hypothetical protein
MNAGQTEENEKRIRLNKGSGNWKWCFSKAGRISLFSAGVFHRSGTLYRVLTGKSK